MSDYLSEELKALAGRLGDHDHQGLTMNGEEVWNLARRLRNYADASLLMERELVRYRRADVERQARERVATALSAHGSNVVKFPRN